MPSMNCTTSGQKRRNQVLQIITQLQDNSTKNKCEQKEHLNKWLLVVNRKKMAFLEGITYFVLN